VAAAVVCADGALACVSGKTQETDAQPRRDLAEAGARALDSVRVRRRIRRRQTGEELAARTVEDGAVDGDVAHAAVAKALVAEAALLAKVARAAVQA
jgi:hypothetical protein